MMNPGNYPANINLTEYQRQALIQMLSNPNMMQNQQGQQWGNSQNNTSQGFTPSNNQGQPIESKLVFIENFEQAKGYPVPLGGSCIMMDKNNLMLYIKHVDGDCNSAYVKYELRLVDGASTPQQQSQQIQTQGTQGEKQDQQLQSNQTQGEQMYMQKLASDGMSRIETLFKLLNHCIEKKEKEAGHQVYKDLYEECIEVLIDEHKNIEAKLKQS